MHTRTSAVGQRHRIHLAAAYDCVLALHGAAQARLLSPSACANLLEASGCWRRSTAAQAAARSQSSRQRPQPERWLTAPRPPPPLPPLCLADESEAALRPTLPSTHLPQALLLLVRWVLRPPGRARRQIYTGGRARCTLRVRDRWHAALSPPQRSLLLTWARRSQHEGSCRRDALFFFLAPLFFPHRIAGPGGPRPPRRRRGGRFNLNLKVAAAAAAAPGPSESESVPCHDTT